MLTLPGSGLNKLNFKIYLRFPTSHVFHFWRDDFKCFRSQLIYTLLKVILSRSFSNPHDDLKLQSVNKIDRDIENRDPDKLANWSSFPLSAIKDSPSLGTNNLHNSVYFCRIWMKAKVLLHYNVL